MVRYLRTISSLLLLGLFAVMNLHSVLPHGHHEHNEHHQHHEHHKHAVNAEQEHQHYTQNQRASAHNIFAQDTQQSHCHHDEVPSEKGLHDFFFFLLSNHAHGLEVPKPVVLVLSKNQVQVEKPSLSLLATHTFTDYPGVVGQDEYYPAHPLSNSRAHFRSNALRGPPA